MLPPGEIRDLCEGAVRIFDMKRIWMLATLAASAALSVGCGGSTSSAEDSSAAEPKPPGKTIGHGSGELNCKTFPFIGSGPDDWRRTSYAFGRFGVSHNLAGNRESDGLLHAKTPVLAEGHTSVVLSVPESERDRVGIALVRPSHPLSTITLKPCADRKRTLWAAGLVLSDRRPVHLDVRIGANKGTIRVGPPESSP